MKRTMTASVTVEDGWFIAQCLEVNVASQGESEGKAIANLKEALELSFEPPTAFVAPHVVPVEIELKPA